MSENNDNEWIGNISLPSRMERTFQDKVLSHLITMIGAPAVAVAPSVDESNIKEWQHELFRKYGKSSCYALFLVLPSDFEAIRYITRYSEELHLISEDNTLVLALSQNSYKIPISTSEYPDYYWNRVVKRQIIEGLSLKVAKIFNIKFSEFPCLLIFEDIRSPQHIKINLKKMTHDEISERMRIIFSIIQKAAKNKKSPIATIKNDLAFEKLQKAGQVTIYTLQDFAGKTFEAALKAWAEASVK